MKTDQNKSNRILFIYSELLSGSIVKKKEIANKFGVAEKTIQRDIEDIRIFLDSQFINKNVHNNLIYDHIKQGYRIEHVNTNKLTNAELLSICKILLDSRAFRKDEINSMLDKLLNSCSPKDNQQLISALIANERYHYIPPMHNCDFLGTMWNIACAIREGLMIKFLYKGIQGKKGHERVVKPLAIMFSDYYFYLAAIIENIDKEKQFNISNDIYPTIYRIDRIKELNVTKTHFTFPYKDRFEEGEFRKRIQFMFGGKLRRIKFIYTGYSIESVLDRLPTAKIIGEDDGNYVIEAEVFGDGIDMWLRSQGELIKEL